MFSPNTGKYGPEITSYLDNFHAALNFSGILINFQMLLSCCLLHGSIIILRHFLYLIYLGRCLDLALFRSYLCDLSFIFTFIFFIINHIISLKQKQFCFAQLFTICCIIFGCLRGMKASKFPKAKVQTQGVSWLLLDFHPISAWCCL